MVAANDSLSYIQPEIKDPYPVKIIPFRGKTVASPLPLPFMTFETLCMLVRELRDDLRSQMLVQKEIQANIQQILALLRSIGASGLLPRERKGAIH